MQVVFQAELEHAGAFLQAGGEVLGPFVPRIAHDPFAPLGEGLADRVIAFRDDLRPGVGHETMLLRGSALHSRSGEGGRHSVSRSRVLRTGGTLVITGLATAYILWRIDLGRTGHVTNFDSSDAGVRNMKSEAVPGDFGIRSEIFRVDVFDPAIVHHGNSRT